MAGLHFSESQFRECLDSVGIGRGDLVYVAASMASFTQWKKPESRVVAILEDVVGPSGTLVMPAFNFGFCQGETFDIERTPSCTGSLSEYFRSLPGVSRTSCPPWHSVCIRGSMAEDLSQFKSGSSFGTGSVLNEIVRRDGRHLSIGCSFHDGVVHMHALEEKLEVPYRYWKRFEGEIKLHGESARNEFFMYVRNEKMNARVDSAETGRRFSELGYVQSATAGLCRVESFRLQDLYQVVEEWMRLDPWLLVPGRDKIAHGGTAGFADSPVMGIDHIGVVSRYSDRISEIFSMLGLALRESGTVPDLGVRCDYYRSDNIRLEIVDPVSEDSRLSTYHQRHPAHPIHHIALRVGNLGFALEWFRRHGIQPLDGDIYRGPRSGESVCFLSPVMTGGLLIELVEINDRDEAACLTPVSRKDFDKNIKHKQKNIADNVLEYCPA